MPEIAAAPVYDAVVMPEKRQNFPKLIIGPTWGRWLNELRREVGSAARQQATTVLTAQAASIASTSLGIGTLSAGLWRVSYYARITQAAGTSSSLTVTLGWIDGGISLTSAGAAITGNTTSTTQSGTITVRVDNAGPITFSTTYASVGAPSMSYRISIVAEELALESA